MCRPDRARRHIVALLAAAVAACLAPAPLVTPGPPELAGAWIDVRHSAGADTSIWLLDPGGNDDLLRITWAADPAGPSAAVRHETRRRYGSWYVTGVLSDTAGRRLCVKPATVRMPGACYRYRLDTLGGTGIAGDTLARRRLVLLNYQGERSTGTRVLLERRP